MNARQAKAYVLRCLAAEARHHLGNGSEWLERPLGKDSVKVDEEGRFTEADNARLCRAVEDVATELERRHHRLSQPRRVR